MDEMISFDDVLLDPRLSTIGSRLSEEISLETDFVKGERMDIPIISSPMNCVTDRDFAVTMQSIGGRGIVHRYQPSETQMPFSGALRPPCAIGLHDHERLKCLYEGGVRVFCIDVANGFSTMVADDIHLYKTKYPDIKIIAGNISNAAGALYLEEAGADALRVGIGGGSACITRIVTGCGCPTLASVRNIHQVIRKNDAQNRIPIIADGGIRYSGDIVKALAAGADSVMLGFLLAPFSTAGRTVTRGTIKYKTYEGQASRSFQDEVRGGLKNGTAPEGVEHSVPMRFDMSAERFIENELCGGIRSAMTYLNARTIQELREAQFIRITEAGRIESYPRLIG